MAQSQIKTFWLFSSQMALSCETTKNNRASSPGVAPVAMADMPVGIGDAGMKCRKME